VGRSNILYFIGQEWCHKNKRKFYVYELFLPIPSAAKIASSAFLKTGEKHVFAFKKKFFLTQLFTLLVELCRKIVRKQ
jgi:hypothetical protein